MGARYPTHQTVHSGSLNIINQRQSRLQTAFLCPRDLRRTLDGAGILCPMEQHGYTADRARYIARMKRIEGQVRGVERMIEENKYCIDILTQISAITSALENVGLALLDEHLKHCVTGAVTGAASDAAPGEHGGTAAVDAKIEEAMQAIKRMVKS